MHLIRQYEELVIEVDSESELHLNTIGDSDTGCGDIQEIQEVDQGVSNPSPEKLAL